MKLSLRSKNGFTIVELLIVVAVIAILAAVAVVGYYGVQSNARDKSLLSDIEKVEAELARYATKNGGVYDSGLNWDSSSGSNSNIRFTPSSGNTVTVTTFGEGYCIRAFNPQSNKKTLQTAELRGDYCVFKWESISVGSTHACGVGINKALYCWGQNTAGQLGNGLTSNSNIPIAVSMVGGLAGKTIKKVSAGSDYTCAIASDNLVYCWGANTNGKLGNGTTTASLIPVAVSTAGVLSGKTVKDISVNQNSACAIASDDRLYCWGMNASYGQLGNASYTNSSVPVAVSTAGVLSGKSIIDVAVGQWSVCALASEGATYCWGDNSYGIFGRGNTTNSNVPAATTMNGVLAGKTIVGISDEIASTMCVVASDNQTYCWGYNLNGQIGDGTTTHRNTPVAVSSSGALSGKTVTQVSHSGGQGCALTTENRLYCWGSSILGNNTISSSLSPLAIPTTGAMVAKDVKYVAGARCAITTDGSAYCWGSNSSGQVGAGSASSNILNPTLVVAPSL